MNVLRRICMYVNLVELRKMIHVKVIWFICIWIEPEKERNKVKRCVCLRLTKWGRIFFGCACVVFVRVCVCVFSVNFEKRKGRTTKSDKRMFLSAKTNFIYAIDMDISEYHLMFNRAVHMKQQTRLCIRVSVCSHFFHSALHHTQPFHSISIHFIVTSS